MTQTKRAMKSGNNSAKNSHERVGKLTEQVNRNANGITGDVEARRALMAAEIYAGRLIVGLEEAVCDLRAGKEATGLEALEAAVTGIHCLADLVAAVDREIGVDSGDNSDLELGHLAMSLHEVAIAQAAGDTVAISLIIARDLVPALSRLSATFSPLEASIALANGI